MSTQGTLRRPDPVSAVGTLGTILSVWAHPDDETYLAAGLMAAARDRGQRVVCGSATAGELGTEDPDGWPPERLGLLRRWEAAAAMAVLGVAEHHVRGLPDGRLAEHGPAGRRWVAQLIDSIRPDTIITFDAAGATGHPDHMAVHSWVAEVWRSRGCPGRVLCATATREHLARFGSLYDDAGTYMSDDRPEGVAEADLDLFLALDGWALDRKVAALGALASQTAPLVSQVGAETYAAMVADETFIELRP